MQKVGVEGVVKASGKNLGGYCHGVLEKRWVKDTWGCKGLLSLVWKVYIRGG